MNDNVARVLSWGDLTKQQKGEVIDAINRLEISTTNAHNFIGGVVVSNVQGSPKLTVFVDLPKFSGWPFRDEIEFNERDIPASEDEGQE